MNTKYWQWISMSRAMTVALAFSLCGIGLSAVAAEEKDEVETLKKKDDQPQDPKADAEQPDEKTADKDKPDAPAAKPKPSLTQQVLDELVGQAKEEAGNPLDAIVERMREAQQRLKKTETDVETRKLQTQIVKDLDVLIEKIKNLPPPKSNPNQPPPPPMGSSDQNPLLRGQGQPKPQNSEKQRGAGDKKPSESTASKSGDKSKQSSNQNQGQPRTPEEEAARQRLAKDVWGHLPPALRLQLLNVYSEKFLPKYDDLVRKYYEALAEQNRKNP